MANLLKFFRSATMPSVAEQNASIGSIWFDTTKNVIKVRTAENGVDADWEVYGTSPADLTAAIGRIATLEGAVKTLNETTLPALKAKLEKAIEDAVAAEAAIARKAEKDLGKRIDDLAAAAVSVAEGTNNHVKVTKSGTVYTVEGVDIASAQGLADEIKRAGDEEARIEGLVTAEAGRAAGEEARIEGLVNTEKDRAKGVEAGLQAAINTLNGADTVSGSVAKAVKDAKDSLLGGAQTLTDFAKVETAIDEAEAAAKAAASVVVEGTDAGNNLTIVPTTDENGATTYTVNLADVASAAKVATLIGKDADKSVRTIANEELAKQLIAEGAAEALDSLQEIAQWIQDHPGDAAAMNDAIAQLQKDVDAIEADYLTESDKKELTDAIATAKVEAMDAASQNTATAITEALGKLDAEVTSTDGAKVTVKVTEVDGKLTAVNVTESDIASAQALATLDAEVQEHEQVVAGALNDLNGRMVTAEGSIADHETRLATAKGEIDALQATVGGLDLGVKTVKGQGGEYVTVTPAEASKGDVTVSVSVATTKATNTAYTNDALATDGYVEEQAAAAVATAAGVATSKANTAESNAKTYADNLMSWVVF